MTREEALALYRPIRASVRRILSAAGIQRFGNRIQQAFEEAVRLRPKDFWPYFARASCEYRLHRMERAAASYAICIAKAPERVDCFCYYNHGLACVAIR